MKPMEIAAVFGLGGVMFTIIGLALRTAFLMYVGIAVNVFGFVALGIYASKRRKK